jgi:hypothetical protein
MPSYSIVQQLLHISETPTLTLPLLLVRSTIPSQGLTDDSTSHLQSNLPRRTPPQLVTHLHRLEV